MRSIIAAALVCICASALKSEGALVYPFLDPVRVIVATNIAAVTNRAELTREERQQFRALIQARNQFERRGRASLVNDVQVLATVSPLLRRAFPDGDFDLLLADALVQYRDVLTITALTLETNLAQRPETPVLRAAANTVDNTIDLLENLDVSQVSAAGTRTLVTAALRLRSVEAALARGAGRGSSDTGFSARVNGDLLQASSDGFSITYNPTAEFLTVTGREVSGIPAVSRTITLFISDVIPGSTSRFLGAPATDSYATYSEQGSTNSATYTSVSGHVTVRINAQTGEVSGRFSFTGFDALDRSNVARVTSGSFSARPE